MTLPPTLPRIKVCGLTRPSDVLAAVEAGADAIGLVDHPASARHVEVERAGELVAQLPSGVPAVLVVAGRARAQVEAYAERAGLGCVQLCADERPEDWRDCGLAILRRVAVEAGAEAEMDAWRELAWAFVLDHPAAPGGTGHQVALDQAALLARRAPCLLAGGLDAQRVAPAVASVRPYGVDASSRLESAPGHKHPERVAAFVRAARQALEELEA